MFKLMDKKLITILRIKSLLILQGNIEVLPRFTLCLLIDSSIWFETLNLEWSTEHIKGSQVRISNLIYLSVKFV